MKCATVVRAKRRKDDNADGNTEQCKFHVSAAMIKGFTGEEGRWRFGKVIKQHTCRVNDVGRLRNVSSRFLMERSVALKAFTPGNRKSHGNTRQVQQTAKTAGIHLKKTQAFNIVKMKSQTTIEYHLASYWFLHTIIDCLRREDPNGTYILDTKDTAHGEVQFQRFYVAPSHSLLNFNGTLQMRVQDGTHATSSFFCGIFLVCVAIDSNRQVKLLAFARVGTENKQNWLWFETLLEQDFPNTKFVHADYSKGIESNEFSTLLQAHNISYGRCFRHMLKNCSSNAKNAREPSIKDGKAFLVILSMALIEKKIIRISSQHFEFIIICSGSEAQLLAWKMAKARTEESYNAAYESLKETHHYCADWLHDLKGMFASYLLIGRRGIVTTNAVEQFNNVMLEARESPISDALLMLMNKSAEQTVHRKQQGMKWKEEGLKIVPHAQETYMTNLTEGLMRQTVVIKYPSENDPLAQVDVSSGSVLNVNSTTLVTLNILTGGIVCDCRFHEEWGVPCVHAVAAIRAIDQNSADLLWFDNGLSIDSYIREYSATPVSMSCIKLLKTNIRKLQPDHRIVKAGRPRKKKRIEAVSKRVCPGCGGLGHFIRTCTAVKVGRLCEKLKEKVEKAAERKLVVLTDEMNPSEVVMNIDADINVNSAEVDDVSDNVHGSDSDSKSDNTSIDDQNNFQVGPEMEI